MTTIFEHQRTGFKRDYLKTLIRLALSDGHVDERERALVLTIGLQRGLKLWQINELLEDASGYAAFLPASLTNRMNLLFDLMQIIYADGDIHERELAFITRIVNLFQLHPETVYQLIGLFYKGTPSVPEWLEFVAFIDQGKKHIETIH